MAQRCLLLNIKLIINYFSTILKKVLAMSQNCCTFALVFEPYKQARGPLAQLVRAADS